MVENKEIRIAIIVGIIMITICILAFIFANAKTPKTQNIDIKVYKLYDKEGTENEHEYRPCSVKTDDISSINVEYRKIMKLSEDSRTKGQINGDYKIISGDNYIAFDIDEENPKVYRGDTSGLYSYNSSLYEYVKKICS